MPITASTKPSSNFEPIPAGTYLARCFSMVHIGTVEDEYQGQKRFVNKVRITWELPTEMKVFNPEKGEQPQAISREFTLSMHEKSTLRAFLTSWRGRGFSEEDAKDFDVSRLVGVPCMLSIVHEPSKTDPTRVRDKISGISTVMKGVTMPPQVNPSFVFELDSFEQSKFDSLPDWLKDKVRQSQEYRNIVSPEIQHSLEVAQKVADFVDDESGADELPF
jgi:hypothetical protein